MTDFKRSQVIISIVCTQGDNPAQRQALARWMQERIQFLEWVGYLEPDNDDLAANTATSIFVEEEDNSAE